MAVGELLGRQKKKIDVDTIIEKGYKAYDDKIEDGCKHINLKISSEMLNEVDRCVIKKKKLGCTRTSWILDAINDKILKEDNI